MSKFGKFKWLMIVLPLVLAVSVAAAAAWEPLMMRFAPEAVLSSAWEKTAEKLDKRSEGSPLDVISDAGRDWAKNGELAVDVAADIYGQEISAQLLVQSVQAKQQAAASASVNFMGEEVKANFYLDKNSAALSVNPYLDGTYYGVTFDSFREDLAASVLGQYLDEEEAAELEESISQLRDNIRSKTDTEALLAPYKKIVEAYIDSLELTTGEAEKTLSGTVYTCDTITLTMDEASLIALMNELLDAMEQDTALEALLSDSLCALLDVDDWSAAIGEMRNDLQDAGKELQADVELVYYLRKGFVAAVDCHLNMVVDGEEVSMQMDVNFGAKPETDEITAAFTVTADGDTAEMILTSTVGEQDGVREDSVTLKIRIPEENTIRLSFATQWNKDSGALELSLSSFQGAKENLYITMDGKLEKTKKGFVLSITPEPELLGGVELTVSISCTTGTEIVTPAFVNLDKWDETVVSTLEGLFGMMGSAAPDA